MRSFQKLVLAVFFGSTLLGACATDVPDADQSEDATAGVGQSSSQIRSADELRVYLKSVAHSPLDQLSPAAKQRFIDSLDFTQRGLASYEVTDLKTITPSDKAAILALFRTTDPSVTAAQLPPGRVPHQVLEGYRCNRFIGCCEIDNIHACNPDTCNRE